MLCKRVDLSLVFKGKAWTVSMSFEAAGLDEKNADREEKRFALWAMPINKGKWEATPEASGEPGGRV